MSLNNQVFLHIFIYIHISPSSGEGVTQSVGGPADFPWLDIVTFFFFFPRCCLLVTGYNDHKDAPASSRPPHMTGRPPPTHPATGSFPSRVHTQTSPGEVLVLPLVLHLHAVHTQRDVRRPHPGPLRTGFSSLERDSGEGKTGSFGGERERATGFIEQHHSTQFTQRLMTSPGLSPFFFLFFFLTSNS